MKRVVSVSLGSSSRDHKAKVNIEGEDFVIERIGTDGDMEKAIRKIRELDGQVDAFGMGGIDLYIVAGNRRYVLRDAKQIARAAEKTPMVDGTGLKNTLERKVIYYLKNDLNWNLESLNVLMVCGVDRFGMAEALSALGCEMVFGDLVYGLGVPLPLRSLGSLRLAARILGPIVSQLPFKWLYPTGSKQETSVTRGTKYFNWADVIAGDFHFIKRFAPSNLEGKIIITNTVTQKDIDDLQARGVKTLVTTTPKLSGRSFGTNVMEGVLITLSGRRPEELTVKDYEELLDRVGFKPNIEHLN